MGISQQIGSSSLSKPGICTSSTRPATPYEGQMIYETDTDKVLVYNGTAWVIPNSPAQNPQGLELVTTATCSSGGTASGGVVTIGTTVSSVTVSSAFSATYDNYKIIVNGGLGSTDDFLKLTLGSTATGYYFAQIFRSYAGSTSGDQLANGAYWNGGVAKPNGISLSMDIFNPFLTARSTFSHSYGAAITSGEVAIQGGFLDNATSYTAFTLTPSAGTITGGTIRVYGYRNS